MSKFFGLGLLGLISINLTACGGCSTLAGCNGSDRSPYYITSVSKQVRGISIPPQTKLTYRSQYFRQEFQQTQALKEQNLTGIRLAEDAAILWGGMPVNIFIQFSNPKIQGVSFYPAIGFKSEPSNAFLRLWKSCESDLGIYLKNPNDWSFNPTNMQITSCGRFRQKSQYTEEGFDQDQADKFLWNINQALQQLPRQNSYPVIQRSPK